MERYVRLTRVGLNTSRNTVAVELKMPKSNQFNGEKMVGWATTSKEKKG